MFADMVDRTTAAKEENPMIIIKLSNLLDTIDLGIDLAVIYAVDNGIRFTIIPDDQMEEARKTASETVVDTNFNGRTH